MATATLRRPAKSGKGAKPTPRSDVALDHIHRFTLAEYQQLIEHGILGEKERCHLINGVIRTKMPENTPHSSTHLKLGRRLSRLLPDEWLILTDMPVQFPNSDSEPEPDFAITSGPETRFDEAKPVAADSLLIVEVADTSLAADRGEMLEIYAGGKVAVYWIVNLVDGVVEVYTQPKGGKKPGYKAKAEYRAGDSVPVVLGGKHVGTIPVSEILP